MVQLILQQLINPWPISFQVFCSILGPAPRGTQPSFRVFIYRPTLKVWPSLRVATTCLFPLRVVEIKGGWENPGFKVVATQICFLCSPTWGRWTHFDEHIFQRGWFNHLTRGEILKTWYSWTWWKFRWKKPPKKFVLTHVCSSPHPKTKHVGWMFGVPTFETSIPKIVKMTKTYCWWKKSCTAWDV